MNLHNKFVKQANVFYRMKYGRINTITFLCIILIIGIPVTVIAFLNYSLGAAIFGLALITLACFYTIYLFSKYVFSYIRIQSDGIEWIQKGKTQYYFRWSDINEIEKSSFLMNATFDLVLPPKIAAETNMKKFQFNCYEELRTYIVEHTKDSKIVEKFKNFDLRY